MKNIVKYIFCSCVAVLFGLIVKSNTIQAFASVDFGMRVEVVESLDNNDDPALQVGDIKVTVTIEHNSGFDAGGTRSLYSTSAFQTVHKANNTLLYEVGDVAAATAYEITENAPLGSVDIGMMRGSLTYLTGDVFSYYLRPLDDDFYDSDYLNIEDYIYEIEVETLISDHVPVTYNVPEVFQYTIPVPYSFVLGNANGSTDGAVTIEDAQVIYSLVETYGEVMVGDSISGLYYSPNSFYAGLFLQINGIYTLSLEIADVNSDGYVNYADASAVFSYYMNNLALLDPYSTPIGQTQTHITYIVAFS